MNFFITVPADGLAPNGARPSAGTVLIMMLDMSCSEILWLSMILKIWIDQITSFKFACEILWNLSALGMLVKEALCKNRAPYSPICWATPLTCRCEPYKYAKTIVLIDLGDGLLTLPKPMLGDC